ncbi:MAG: VWA domain-containing protein [Paracoccaceae bacterium]
MATFSGNNARNIIFGTRYDDRIFGAGGNDVLDGNSGFDRIFGGLGADIIQGGDDPDYVHGGPGNDIIVAGTGSDTVYGDDRGSGGGTTANVTTSNTTTIPGTGQDFSISLTAPDASNASSYGISGFVSAGAVTSSQVNIALAVDVSGSTGGTYSGTPVGDVNGNGTANEIIDGEIAGALALMASVRAAGFGSATVNLITFDSSVQQSVVLRANADANNNGVPDINEALRGLTAIGGTDFEPPLQEAISFFNSRSSGQNYVFFLSDGAPFSTTNYSDEVNTLINPSGIDATIRAFPIGSNSSPQSLDLLDDGVDNDSAPQITDPGALSAAITGGGISPADVQEVRISVDGSRVATIPSGALTDTPFGLRYNVNLTGLSTTNPENVRVVAVASDPASTRVVTKQVVENLSTDGNDKIFGGTGSDLLFGEGGEDVIFGGEGNDRIEGNVGADTLFGGDGNDTVAGGINPDQVFGGIGNDRLFGGGANDRLYGGIGDDYAIGHTNDDIIFGGDGNDTLLGAAGRDALFGGNGADRLYGGTLADTLIGGGGRDTVTGGGGPDTFAFANNHDRMVVTDFTNNIDTIRLNDNLWSGSLTASQVVSSFATVVGGNAVFDFGGGDILTLQGVSNLSILADDISII